MKYKVVIRDIANKDIEDLSDYVFRHSFDLEIAKKVSNRLYEAIFSLRIFPSRFEKYIKDYRRMILDWKYKIIYKIEEEKKKVVIVRIFRVELEGTMI